MAVYIGVRHGCTSTLPLPVLFLTLDFSLLSMKVIIGLAAFGLEYQQAGSQLWIFEGKEKRVRRASLSQRLCHFVKSVKQFQIDSTTSLLWCEINHTNAPRHKSMGDRAHQVYIAYHGDCKKCASV
jgi:hypothetical protein